MSDENDLPTDRSSTGRVVEIWSLLLRHLLLILFLSGVGTGLGYLQFIRTPPVYQSTSRLHIRNDSKNQAILFQGAEAAVQPGQHPVIIATPLIAEQALDIELDDELSDEHSKRRLRDLPCFANHSNPVDHILARLTARAHVENHSVTNEIVDLGYRDSDPVTTKAVLEAVMKSYQSYLGDSQKDGNKKILDLIQDARFSLLNQLKDIEARRNQFQQDAPLLFPSDGSGDSRADFDAMNLHRARMLETEARRKKLYILATEKRAELNSITEALAQGSSREAVMMMILTLKPDTRSSEGGMNSPASEIFQMKREEQLMLLELGSEHPKIKALQKKIELTENFILNQADEDGVVTPGRKRDFLSICISAYKQEIRSIEATIMELDEYFEAERHDAKSLAAYEFRSQQFQKEYERIETIYDHVLKRLDEMNLSQEYTGYKATVIAPPSIGRYVAPNLNQNLLTGTLCGAALGVLLAYLIESNDRTFRSPEEVSEQLGLPVVGHIPVIERGSFTRSSKSSLDAILVTVHKPKSRMAESYRAVRTSLYFSTRGEQHKVIQITSPNPGDGKTTLCSNLAVSIAQSGKRVLVIDADFRRPRIHEIFALDKSVGMSSVIAGDAELPDAIQATEVENLWGLACGPIPENPCELLTSHRFEELLDVLREQYDFVIIDTPPLLSVTDPGAVAARVDGIILTIRITKRTRNEALRAMEILAPLGVNTLGVVVNGSGQKSGYGYGYGYGYNYGYAYGKSYTYGAYEYRESGNSNGENPYYAEKSDSDTARRRQRSRSSE